MNRRRRWCRHRPRMVADQIRQGGGKHGGSRIGVGVALEVAGGVGHVDEVSSMRRHRQAVSPHQSEANSRRGNI